MDSPTICTVAAYLPQRVVVFNSRYECPKSQAFVQLRFRYRWKTKKNPHIISDYNQCISHKDRKNTAGQCSANRIIPVGPFIHSLIIFSVCQTKTLIPFFKKKQKKAKNIAAANLMPHRSCKNVWCKSLLIKNLPVNKQNLLKYPD